MPSRTISQRKLGEFLYKTRMTAGISLRGLARQAGISAAHLSNVEKGKHGISIPTLTVLLECLGVEELPLFLSEQTASDGAMKRHLGTPLYNYLLSLPAEDARALVQVARRISRMPRKR